MDLTLAEIPGDDAWIRSLHERIRRLERGQAELRAATGSAAGDYDESGISIGVGGYLTGDGGPLTWAGPAAFSGETSLSGPTTFTGALTFAAGAIAAAAVDGQAAASSLTNSAGNFAISRTSWTSLVTVDLPVPSWATRAVIFTTAIVAPVVLGHTYSYVRARVIDPLGNGPVAPAIFNQQVMTDPGYATSMPWKGSVIENPPATITCRVEAIHEHTSNSIAANAQSAAGINVIAVWSRGT